MTEHHPFINGRSVIGEAGLREVRNPYNNKIVGTVGYATSAQINTALDAVMTVFSQRKLSTQHRSEILSNAAVLLSDLSEECALIITAESGKPITYSRIEVQRAIFTLQASAKAALTMDDDIPVHTMDAPNAVGREVTYRYFPAGPIAAIAPFNFPLNLVMHKVAPAIACGCAIILKPPPQTPLTSFFLADILEQSGLPAGWLNVVPCENEVAEQMIQDDRIKTLSFTGSAAVGWKLKALVPKKKVTLELGGNAAIVVDEVEDWDKLIQTLCTAGFYYAGQVCISLQRLYVARDLYDELLDRFIEAAANLPTGDPMADDTVVGPMINEKEAKRAWSWIEEAINTGAIKHTGEFRAPNWITPTILTEVPTESKLNKEEAFSPVVIVEAYDSFSDAIEKVNSSRYGLQAGVYTSDDSKMKQAYNNLEVGGVIINNSTTFRIDTMPYGGAKDSGFGREGVLWAMREMCEVKVLVQ